MKIELSQDTLTDIVVKDLMIAYYLCREYDDEETMTALQTVLEYYMVPSEYKEWYESNLSE